MILKRYIPILITLILFLSGLYYYLKLRNPLQDEIKLPDKDLCEVTDTGWSCVLTKEDIFQFDLRLKELENDFKDICENQGGKWTCYGFCLPVYTHYCDFPFYDTGKKCKNSEECLGKCILEIEYVRENYSNREMYENIVCNDDCTGQCSEYPLRHCDWWFEVNNGIIEDHTGIMCD